MAYRPRLLRGWIRAGCDSRCRVRLHWYCIVLARMAPYRGLRRKGTSPRGRLCMRKDGSSSGRLFDEVLGVQNWALDITIVQHQRVSLRRITRARTLRVLLIVFVGTLLSSQRCLRLLARKASSINRLLRSGIIGFPDVILEPFGFRRGSRPNATVCTA